MQLSFEVPTKGLGVRFQRHRHDVEVVQLAITLYQQGLSFRQTAIAMTRFGYPVSHVTVWRWLQRVGRRLQGKVWNGPMPQMIVVDETIVRTGWGHRWVYAAIDPFTKRVLFMQGYARRTMEATHNFFELMIKAYNGQAPRIAVVDGGPWYYYALEKLGIKRVRLKGDVRNHVERFYRYLKQRMNGLDRYFPKGNDYRPLENWMRVFAWYYNHVRRELPIEFIT